MKKNSFEISWATIWKIFVLIGLVTFIYLAKSTIGIVLIGISFSLAIQPLINFLSEKTKIPRLLSLIIVFVMLALIVVAALYIIVPVFINELYDFILHLNETLSKITKLNIILSKVNIVQTINENLETIISKTYKSTTDTFLFVLKFIVFVISTIVISLYLSLEKDGVKKMIEAIIPEPYEKGALIIFNNFDKKIRKWLITQIILSTFIGLSVFIATFLMGIKYPFVLGITSGILEVVPIIGPIISGTLTFILALSQSFELALYALIFFVALQQIENHILIPVLMGKTMKIHPVLIVFSLLAGSEIAGFVGIILAVPISILIQEIFSYLSILKSSNLKNISQA